MKEKKKLFWFDMQAPPDVQFFRPFLKEFKNIGEFSVTARDYAETIDLLNRFGIKYSTVGSENSTNSFCKIYHTILRSLQLYIKIEDIDVGFALGNLHSIYVTKLHNKILINFMDNELGLKEVDNNRSIIEYGVIKSQTLLADYIFVPSVFPIDALVEDGMEKERIYSFDGYKEDIYIADFKPNKNTLKELPFTNFVVVRPESSAIYKDQIPSLVPQLLKSLVSEGFNIVFLPRVSADLKNLDNINSDNIFIPKIALNGLDLCYYAQAVLTGSGTLAREAACMGTPSVSFFPNAKLLAVDQDMVNKGWVLHSRDTKEIIEYILSVNKKTDLSNLNRSKEVQRELFCKLRNIISTE